MINCLYCSVSKGEDIFPSRKKTKMQLLGKYKAGKKSFKYQIHWRKRKSGDKMM